MNRERLIRSLLILTIGTAIALAIGLVGRALYVDPKTGGGREASATGAALIGGPFTLTDQDGKRVDEAQFRGKLMLVNFGYSFCPDVCPTALLDMSQAMEALGADADKVQPIFITIDPERDTPPEMKKFLSNFDPRLIGLTGSAPEIAAAAKAYRVFYARAKGAERDYLMDHSALIYLMDRNGKYLSHFSVNTRGQQMAEAIKKFL
jgi:cytochrome oxidase Cu insertion factor (SCO1/SenC/PrrC family)